MSNLKVSIKHNNTADYWEKKYDKLKIENDIQNWTSKIFQNRKHYYEEKN